MDFFQIDLSKTAKAFDKCVEKNPDKWDAANELLNRLSKLVAGVQLFHSLNASSLIKEDAIKETNEIAAKIEELGFVFPKKNATTKNKKR